MLLRLFKGTGPGTILLIVLTLLLVWAGAFFRLKNQFSLYFDLYPMPLYGMLSSLIGTNPLPGIIFTIFLVAMMAYFMVTLNTTIFFISTRTFLPAVIYILLSGFFPQYQLMNPAIFGAMFLMLAIRQIMEAYRKPGVAYSFFDAGILIGTGSLFYADLIWFGILIIIGMMLLRTGSAMEVFVSLIGLITPFVLTMGIYYIAGLDLKDLFVLMEYNLFSKPDSYVFTPFTIAVLAFTGLVLLAAMIHLSTLMNIKKIKSRKTFFLLSWLFLISMVVYFALPSVSVEIVWITGIPVSFILTHYFLLLRKKTISGIIFSLLFGLVLTIQVLYLK